jgi:single-strand DNA-binding protein
MASYNKVIIAGNLTRDPEIRTAGSAKVADIRLAISEAWRDKTTGQRREVTCFVDVVAWERLADFCQQYFFKGKGMLVEGRLQLDEWTDKQTNEKRSKLRVRADRIMFWGAPPRQDDAPAAPQRTAAPTAPSAPVAQDEPPAFDDDSGGDLTQDDEALPF